MSARLKRLQPGDVVSAEARIVFSDGYARMLAAGFGAQPHLWRTLRVDGTVRAKASSGRWTVEFMYGAAAEPRTLRRGLLEFKSRPEKTGEAAAAAAMMDIAGVEAPPAEADAGEDSDDNASVASDAGAPEEMPEPEEEPDPAVATAEQHDGEWQRDDHANISQRAKDGVDHDYAATLNGFSGDIKGASLFDLGCHFLPVDFLTQMAKTMEKNGKARAKSNPDYKNWRVSIDDVYQWIGCWLYMLAYPVPGPRSQYFKTPNFGPYHHSEFRKRLALAFLTLGKHTWGEPLAAPAPESPAQPGPSCEHKFTTFEKLTGKRAEGHVCGYCGQKGYLLCTSCFPDVQHAGYAICNPTTGRDCLVQHLRGVAPEHSMHTHAKSSAMPLAAMGCATRQPRAIRRPRPAPRLRRAGRLPRRPSGRRHAAERASGGSEARASGPTAWNPLHEADFGGSSVEIHT
jgi:hypothetical protein